jgi:hypothetical protein
MTMASFRATATIARRSPTRASGCLEDRTVRAEFDNLAAIEQYDETGLIWAYAWPRRMDPEQVEFAPAERRRLRRPGRSREIVDVAAQRRPARGRVVAQRHACRWRMIVSVPPCQLVRQPP